MAASPRGGRDASSAAASPTDRALWRARSLLAARTIQWRDGWEAAGPDPHRSLPRLPAARAPWPQLNQNSRKRQRASAGFAGHQPRRVALSPFFETAAPPCSPAALGPAGGRGDPVLRLRCPCGAAVWPLGNSPTDGNMSPQPATRRGRQWGAAHLSGRRACALALPAAASAVEAPPAAELRDDGSTPPRCKRPRQQTAAAALPPSPLRLLEEGVGGRPWHLLLGCALLNRTQRVQADAVLPALVRKWPTPAALAAADRTELAAMLRHVGTHRRRAECLTRMAGQWCEGRWRCPCQLTAVGPYALSAWRIWVTDDWERCAPGDGALAMFRAWLGDVSGDRVRSRPKRE